MLRRDLPKQGAQFETPRLVGVALFGGRGGGGRRAFCSARPKRPPGERLPLFHRAKGGSFSESLQIDEKAVTGNRGHGGTRAVQLGPAAPGEGVLHDDGSLALQDAHGCPVLLLGLGRQRQEGAPPAGADQPEALSLQRAGVEAGGVSVGGDAADGSVSGRVFRRRTGDDVQRQGGVAHAPGQRARHVPIGRVDGKDAFERHEPERRLDPYQRLGRRGVLDRAARLGPQPQHGEAGVHGRGRPAAGTARHAIDGIRVQRLARRRAARAGSMAGEVRQVGLPQHDRAGVQEPLDHGRVVARDHVHPSGGGAEPLEAGGRRQSGVVDVVLDHDGHAVERAARAFRPVLPVQRLGSGQGLRVHRHEGVVALLVDGDSVQEGLYELDDRVDGVPEVALHLVGGQLHHVDRRAGAGLLPLHRRAGRAAVGSQQEDRQHARHHPSRTQKAPRPRTPGSLTAQPPAEAPAQRKAPAP